MIQKSKFKDKMNKGDRKRSEIISVLSYHFLKNGLKEMSLKQLAVAADTSDRMLIHYFKDKNTIVKITLNKISEDFITILEQKKAELMPFTELIQFLTHALNQKEFKPYLRLWMDLIASTSIQEEPYLGIAQEISDAFFLWIQSNIYVGRNQNLEQQSSLVLATIEGFVMLDGLKRESRIQSALKALESNHSKKKHK